MIPIAKKMLIFICNWVDSPSKFPINEPINVFGENIKILRVMCTSRVSRPIILQALNEGYQKVIVMGCAECKNKTANQFAQSRMLHTTELMKTTGIQENFLQYVIISPNSDIKQIISETIKK